ncbi:hypothetical protein MLC59_02425 [Marinobacter bryozoorum]|uniref:hypothetical protein n=1 Tax=Marinobacter bryozoorum TaxID=256324 RepID=UPI0020041DFA|nr:hypothetical protein [Marinobacter bryozoorum]MCK7543024.1 hypothetical protein [Marinobacter bryozoorum]
MKTRLSLLCALLISIPAGASTFTFEGTATSLDDNALYRERHEVTGRCISDQWQPEVQQVEYVRTENTDPFASKTLTYRESLLRPEVDFRQPEFNERLVVSQADDKLTTDWSMEDEEGQRASIPVTRKTVVDTGFDHFIRANWRALTKGEAVPFSMVAPTRGKSYDFVAEPASEPLDGADYSFRIRPEGMVLRMLVDPIRLGYNRDGFLTRYAGLGNIRRNKDENHIVTISYRVIEAPDCSLLPADQ